MGQISANFSLEMIETMKQFYQEESENPPQGALFRARKNGVVITGYKSGKVLFQGANVESEFAKWEKQQVNRQRTSRSKTESKFAPPESLFSQNHIGSDESGSGDYFGLITACAVYVEAGQIEQLREIGIQDSKALSDRKVKQLAKQLLDLHIPYSLIVLRNERYNELQRQGWTQAKMKTMLHHAVIEKVMEKRNVTSKEGILIDQFCPNDVFINYLTQENKLLFDHTYFMTKAEDYSIAVAAASIIARASSLKELDELSQFVGVDLLKGASAEVDRLAAQMMGEKGESILNKIAKIHFANTKKAKKYLAKN